MVEYEYYATFSIDNIYGTVFYSITLLHGTHVYIGIFLLSFCMALYFNFDRSTNIHYLGEESRTKHPLISVDEARNGFLERAGDEYSRNNFGTENIYRIADNHVVFFATYYWHFVDVVWLFVFTFIYV
jgi:heme/copper-type cytochrome/quinol oxidase subunit 3